MQTLSWLSIVFYCAFGIFVFYQQLHAKNFQGASQAFALTLNISAVAGMLTGIAYLVYYGWATVWWAPGVIFIVGLVASPIGQLQRAVDNHACRVRPGQRSCGQPHPRPPLPVRRQRADSRRQLRAGHLAL